MISELKFLAQLNDKLQTLALQVGMIGEIEEVLALVQVRMVELQHSVDRALASLGAQVLERHTADVKIPHGCDKCGKSAEAVGWWATMYRKAELKAGRDDPGYLCGACSGERAGKRIGAEVLKRG